MVEILWDITWFGIFSLAISIVIGSILSLYMHKIDNNRRNRENAHYKELVQRNMVAIKTIITGLYQKTINRDDTYYETISDYIQNKELEMKDLKRDTLSYLQQWRSMPKDCKTKSEQAVKIIDWILEEYYPLKRPDEIKNKRCVEKIPELQRRKKEFASITNEVQNL